MGDVARSQADRGAAQGADEHVRAAAHARVVPRVVELRDAGREVEDAEDEAHGALEVRREGVA